MSQWTRKVNKDADYPAFFNHMPTTMCFAEYGDTRCCCSCPCFRETWSLQAIVDSDVESCYCSNRSFACLLWRYETLPIVIVKCFDFVHQIRPMQGLSTALGHTSLIRNVRPTRSSFTARWHFARECLGYLIRNRSHLTALAALITFSIFNEGKQQVMERLRSTYTGECP